MASKRSWRQRRIDSLNYNYGVYAERWTDKHDDRKVFSNIYFMVLEALESLPEEPNNLVCVAMHKQIDEERKVLDEIKQRYEAGRFSDSPNPVKVELRDTMDRFPGILKRIMSF